MHLSNLPENLAFFSGAIDEAGSFGGIYQSAVLAYGSDLVKDPPSSDRFVDHGDLQAAEKAGLFKDQKIAIAPIRHRRRRDVRRDQSAAEQGHPVPVRAEHGDARHVRARRTSKNLEAIKKLLQVSPGSTLLLRGHVDNALVAEFRQTGRRSVRAHAGAARDRS